MLFKEDDTLESCFHMLRYVESDIANGVMVEEGFGKNTCCTCCTC
jgi:hypothetical protein